MSDTDRQYADRQKQWDDLFRAHEWGKYPAEELIRFVARHYYPVADRAAVRFLDLGCGTATCAWYLAREGFSVCGVDGSETAIMRARQRFRSESLDGQFDVGAIHALPYEDGCFDSVVENASTCCNPWDECLQIMQEVRRVLKPGGRYFGIHLGADTTVEGDTVDQSGYYTRFTGGALKGRPPAILFSRQQVAELMQGFDQVSVDYISRTSGGQDCKIQTWAVSGLRT